MQCADRSSFRPGVDLSGWNAFPEFHPGLFSVPPSGRKCVYLLSPTRCSASIKLAKISLMRVRWPSPLARSQSSTCKSRRTLTARRCSRREKMKIAPGITRGNRRPATPPSRRADVNQPVHDANRNSFRPYGACLFGWYAFPGFHPELFSVPPYGRKCVYFLAPTRCSASIRLKRISLMRVRWPSPLERSQGSQSFSPPHSLD